MNAAGGNSGAHLIPVGDSPFGHDPYLGRTLKPGQDFIGADGFLSFADAVAEIKASGKPVILNAGDSSTAGWDTRVTVDNKARKAAGEPLLSAFFRYPTYADLLRAAHGEEFVVLNAGIPGHTTINGLRRLRDLLERFRRHGIQVDYVSLYFGNNDCQWEFNVEDKSRLRSSRLTPLFIDRLRLKLQRTDRNHIRLRTNLRDFARNVRAMLDTCREFGAAPLLIVPEVPLYWEPGKRFVAEQFPVDESMPGGAMVLAALARARELWDSVRNEPWSDAKAAALESAREMDFVVPRLKKTYRESLEAAARDLEVPLVRTRIPRETDDISYFIDYCHPIGESNEAIAAQLIATVRDYAAGKIRRTDRRTPLLYKILDSRLVNGIARRLGGGKPVETDPANQDIYTLY